MPSSHCPCCGFPLNEEPVDVFINEPVGDRTIIDHDFKFNFGKYFRRTVKDVLAENPSYFVWLARNASDNYLIDAKLLSEAQRKIPRRSYGPIDDEDDHDDWDSWDNYGND